MRGQSLLKKERKNETKKKRVAFATYLNVIHEIKRPIFFSLEISFNCQRDKNNKKLITCFSYAIQKFRWHEKRAKAICTTKQSILMILSSFFRSILNRQLPAPYVKAGPNGTSIPLPATVLLGRRCPPDKVRPLPPTPSHQSEYSILRNFYH